MIESIAKRLDVPVEKFPMNLETHGKYFSGKHTGSFRRIKQTKPPDTGQMC